MKPRLTRAVMDGLGTLARLAEAGGPEDILGVPERAFTADHHAKIRDVNEAIDWIENMRVHRALKAAQRGAGRAV